MKNVKSSHWVAAGFALLGMLSATTAARAQGVEVDARLSLPAGAETTLKSPSSLPVETLDAALSQPVAKDAILLQLDRAKLQKDLDNARKELERAQKEKRRLASERRGATSSPSSQDPAALRAAQEIGYVEAAEQRAMSDLATLQTELAESTVRAPDDGFVYKQLFAVGAKTKKRKPLLLFAEAGKTVIEISLPAADALPFTPGTNVRLSALSGEVMSFTGRVLSATPSGDRVELRLQPTELPFFALGSSARVQLSAGS